MSPKQTVFMLLETMRFPLAFLVVIAHMVPFHTPAVTISFEYEAMYTFISELISHHIAKIPVSFFFIISGYFFYYHTKNLELEQFKGKLYKKLRSLLIPYLAWNTIMLIANFTVSFIKERIFSYPAEPYTQNIYYIFWEGPINFPLWYIRDLMIISILSPILFYFLKYTKLPGLLCLYIVYVLYHSSIFPGLGMKSIFYFSVGIYLAINQIDILKFTAKNKVLVYLITFIILLFCVLSNDSPLRELYSRVFLPLGIISMVNLFAFLYKYENLRSKLLKLSSSTFFIYVIHEIFIINWIKGFIHRYEILSTGIGKIISYFIGPILVTVICLVLFKLMLKFLPKTLYVLTGHRSLRNITDTQ